MPRKSAAVMQFHDFTKQGTGTAGRWMTLIDWRAHAGMELTRYHAYAAYWLCWMAQACAATSCLPL